MEAPIVLGEYVDNSKQNETKKKDETTEKKDKEKSNMILVGSNNMPMYK